MPSFTWEQRHQQVDALLSEKRVREALSAIRDDRSLGSQGRSDQRNREIDLALAVLWSAKPLRRSTDANAIRQAALPHLKQLPRAMMHDGDFSHVKTLQSAGTGVVDVVRCRHDRRVYILKSVVKGAARREPFRNVPKLEQEILQKATLEVLEKEASDSTRDWHCFTPRLHASFPTAASLHMVLEYFPAGDLESLLESAGQADTSYPGKAKEGGLLQETWVKAFAVDMVAGVAWLHSLGFAHR